MSSSCKTMIRIIILAVAIQSLHLSCIVFVEGVQTLVSKAYQLLNTPQCLLHATILR